MDQHRDQVSVRGRILVVDDEPGIRSAIVRVLSCEHEVVPAVSGEEGQAILECDQAFDLLYVDLMMPQMSGIDLYTWLRQRNPSLAAQVVFMTGGVFTSETSQFLAGVENPRVEKPFEVASLRKMTGELVLAARGKRNQCSEGSCT